MLLVCIPLNDVENPTTSSVLGGSAVELTPVNIEVRLNSEMLAEFAQLQLNREFYHRSSFRFFKNKPTLLVKCLFRF